MTKEQLKQLEKDLWAAADNLRANSDLKSSEYSTPVLGLIFLKFADNNYRRHEAEIIAEYQKLEGIPPEAFTYRLGNRSALEWVIDQYQVSIDKRSGITNHPNRDEPDYIAKLIGKVITVSLETQKLIAQLPPLKIEKA